MASDAFSIVIPSHRRFDLLKLCLQSLTRYAPATVETIVVDDGSNNGCVSQVANTFGVKWIRNDKPRGFCAAVNAGIAAASNDIVQLLNDDAEVTAGWWYAVLPHFDDPRVAAVAPLVLKNQPGPTVIDSAGDDYDEGGFAKKQLHRELYEARFPKSALRLRKSSLEETSEVTKPTSEVGAVSACAAFYRKSALLRIGGFPEAFEAYFDDVDVSLRLRRVGYRLLFEPQSQVWHRVSSSYGRPKRRLIELQSRNEEWLYWRNNQTWKTLPRHAAVLAGKAMRRVEEGTFGPWLAGRLRAMAFRSSPPSRSVRSCPGLSPVLSSGSSSSASV